MKSLPDDMIHEILSRAPTASLLKCRTVCKSWNSHIKTSAFILNSLKSNNNNDELLMVYSANMAATYNSEYLFLDFINVKDGHSKCRVSPCYDFRRGVTSIVESYGPFGPIETCNGLVCIQLRKLSNADRVHVLWNPCVRKFLTLPRPSITTPYAVYKFGYDSVNNDYKLVQIVFQRRSCIFHVFSLLTGSWKNLNPPADFVNVTVTTSESLNCSVVVNGALHWISCTSNSVDILTFDLSSEVFGKFKAPESLPRDIFSYHCVNYKECLAILCRRSWPEDFYDMWVMKEYGSVGSWTKLPTILPPDCFRRIRHQPVKCFTECGLVLHGTLDNGVVSSDHEGNQAKIIFGDKHCIFSMHPFVESLVLLDRSDAYSY